MSDCGQCARAYEYAPFYRRKWDQAGFHPSHLKSLEDFEMKVPVVQKKDLRDAQERMPPFGDDLCVPDTEIFHIHGTSGTTGRPTAFAIGRNDWRTIANAHARVMWGMGLRPGDMICVAAVFSLHMGSWGALAGRRTPWCEVLSFRGRCERHVIAVRAMAQHDKANCILRHAHLRTASGAGCRRGGLDPHDFQLNEILKHGFG